MNVFVRRILGIAIVLSVHGGNLSGIEPPEGFVFEGRAIPPGMVAEFECSLADPADHPPPITAVDLASWSSSRGKVQKCKTLSNGCVMSENGNRWFGYEHIGTTPNGTHVLVTVSGGGGGTMVAKTVVLVRFGSEDYFIFKAGDKKPVIQHRDVLRCVGQIALGDRDDGKIELRGKVLTLGKSKYRDKDVDHELP